MFSNLLWVINTCHNIFHKKGHMYYPYWMLMILILNVLNDYHNSKFVIIIKAKPYMYLIIM